jgi:hypothetical protein
MQPGSDMSEKICVGEQSYALREKIETLSHPGTIEAVQVHTSRCVCGTARTATHRAGNTLRSARWLWTGTSGQGYTQKLPWQGTLSAFAQGVSKGLAHLPTTIQRDGAVSRQQGETFVQKGIAFLPATIALCELSESIRNEMFGRSQLSLVNQPVEPD